MNFKLIDFHIFGDDRGSLVSLEANNNIPFDIKRVYYIFDTKKDVVRGKHAHKNLQQILIAVNGSCKVLLDNKKEKQVFELNNPAQGLYIKNNVWREMFDFSSDCVLMVLASEIYIKEDYIFDYEGFKNE
ncbi:MAG: sugar 3,4-ketoisomerase [Alphaproteobacteria bacterium]